MAHFGIVCPPVSGHVNPLGALGKELAGRGHQVTLVSLLDAQAAAESFGLAFAAYGQSVLPQGAVRERSARLGTLSGMQAVRFTGRMFCQETELQLAELPELLAALRLNGLIVDQVSPAAGAVADRLQLPFATVCAALPLNEDPAVPPPVFGWKPGNGPWRRLRNRMGFQLLRLVSRPIRNRINAFRRQHGLVPHRRPVQFSSSLAILSQLPGEFDFPRACLPERNWGQVLRSSIFELCCEICPDLSALSSPVGSITSPRAVIDAKPSIGTSKTARIGSPCSARFALVSTGAATSIAR
jgi:zeaxanthin glucosyltransferase